MKSTGPGGKVILESGGKTLTFPSSNRFANQRISTPLTLDDAFLNKSFQIHLLAKRDVKENEITTVIDGSRDNRRIGWCIPVNALDSNEHDFASNPHFQRYAFMAIIELFQYNLDSFFTLPFDEETQIRQFSDVLHQSACVLIISTETLDAEGFELDRFMPSLIAHGYSKLSERNPSDIIWSTSPKEAVGTQMILLPISSDLGDSSLLATMLHNAVVYESRPVFSFFYAYQVIELLMEHIFMTEQEAILKEYNDSASDLASAKDVIEKLQRISSEKKRLGLLISEYSSCRGYLDELRSSCGDFLRIVSRPSGAEFGDYFYGTRNFVFHQLRYVHSDKEQLLNPVIRDFIEFLPSLLSTYKVRLFKSTADSVLEP